MSANSSDPETLKRKIESVFPRNVFSEAVTLADGQEWREELDDDLDLAKNLKGKSWDQIPGEFIDRHWLGLTLLTPRAFRAFLPAWLIRSLEMCGRNDDLGDGIVYFCSKEDPKRIQQFPDWPELRMYRIKRLEQLDATQLDVLRKFVAFWMDHSSSSLVRGNARSALEQINGLSRGPRPDEH